MCGTPPLDPDRLEAPRDKRRRITAIRGMYFNLSWEP